MWWFLANLDFWQWLWAVVLGLLVVLGWLWVVVACTIDQFVVFFFFFFLVVGCIILLY